MDNASKKEQFYPSLAFFGAGLILILAAIIWGVNGRGVSVILVISLLALLCVAAGGYLLFLYLRRNRTIQPNPISSDSLSFPPKQKKQKKQKRTKSSRNSTQSSPFRLTQNFDEENEENEDWNLHEDYDEIIRGEDEFDEDNNEEEMSFRPIQSNPSQSSRHQSRSIQSKSHRHHSYSRPISSHPIVNNTVEEEDPEWEEQDWQGYDENEWENNENEWGGDEIGQEDIEEKNEESASSISHQLRPRAQSNAFSGQSRQLVRKRTPSTKAMKSTHKKSTPSHPISHQLVRRNDSQIL